ncbi:hypothetical protein ACFV9W_32700 [Streptomyces sp. NPDC059897]|uniref:hypothetical protein n=1 Tax=Streptomyces sp. NPDC059897 TaxID=3346994 RepID=UPI003667E7A6
MARTRSGTGRWQRLLLFAALLFGVVGMHTLGHPSGHGAGHDGAMPMGGAHVAAAEHGVAVEHGAAAEHGVAAEHGAGAEHGAPYAATADPSATTVHERPDSPGHGGMDPLNVCLAVLGSFTLLLLTVWVLRPLLAAVAPGPRSRGLALAPRPNPPPPRSLLSRLSVLRI